MKRTSEIHAVDMIRQIRDTQAKKLAGKSSAEVIEFFNRAASRAGKTRRPLKRSWARSR